MTECASFNGSGDDATMAVMVIPGTDWTPDQIGIAAISPASAEQRSTWTSVTRLRHRFGSAWVGGVLGGVFAVLVVVAYALVR